MLIPAAYIACRLTQHHHEPILGGRCRLVALDVQLTRVDAGVVELETADDECVCCEVTHHVLVHIILGETVHQLIVHLVNVHRVVTGDDVLPVLVDPVHLQVAHMTKGNLHFGKLNQGLSTFAMSMMN